MTTSTHSYDSVTNTIFIHSKEDVSKIVTKIQIFEDRTLFIQQESLSMVLQPEGYFLDHTDSEEGVSPARYFLQSVSSVSTTTIFIPLPVYELLNKLT